MIQRSHKGSDESSFSMVKVVDLHSGRKRFRPYGMPDFAKRELEQLLTYPCTIKVPDTDHIFRYRTTDWDVMDGSDENIDDDFSIWIRRKSTHGWIDLGEDVVGAFQVNGYEASSLIWNEDFLYIMDQSSGYEADFSHVISEAWNDEPCLVFDYGGVTELEYVWLIKPSTELRPLAEALEQQIVKPLITRTAAHFIKVFPLEYEGKISQNPAAKVHLNQRVDAMKRLTSRLFAMKPLPGKDGDNGWMWKPGSGFEGALRLPSNRNNEDELS